MTEAKVFFLGVFFCHNPLSMTCLLLHLSYTFSDFI